jgi:nickel superoxide dismutase
MKTVAQAVITAAVVLFAASSVYSHCEIPCGIYDDAMRFEMIDEHITTIEKSMNMILTLSAAAEINYNQLVRWVVNKENHAGYLQEIVTQYFLAQRVKPVDTGSRAEYESYVKKLALLHEMLVLAMKAKQTDDPALIEKLKTAASAFRAEYRGHGGKESIPKGAK